MNHNFKQFWMILLLTLPLLAVPKAKDPVIDAMEPYSQIQKALSQDNFEKAKATAQTMKTLLDKTLKDPSKSRKALPVFEPALKELVSLSSSVKIEEMRITFGNLSKIFVTYLKEHPEASKPYHLFFCPMFPQGYAFWIQPKAEPLQNPYWGSQMLDCGVKRPWKK